MVGFCHLTDSHHYHHGQKPTMVGICHGGNVLGNHDDRAVCFEQVHLRVFAHGQLDAPDTTEQCKQRQETDHCRVACCQFEN